MGNECEAKQYFEQLLEIDATDLIGLIFVTALTIDKITEERSRPPVFG